jgi:hypothetical protein
MSKKGMTTESVVAKQKKSDGVSVKKTKRIKPIVVETIHSTAELAEKELVRPVYEKHVITGTLPVPEGHVRCIVLIDHKGMLNELYKDDVIDMPERRFKTECNHGHVKAYTGPRIPNKQR